MKNVYVWWKALTGVFSPSNVHPRGNWFHQSAHLHLFLLFAPWKKYFIYSLNCDGTERCGRQLQVSDGNPCRCSNPDFDVSIEGPFLYQHFPSRDPAAAALDDAFAAVVSSKYTWQQLCWCAVVASTRLSRAKKIKSKQWWDPAAAGGGATWRRCQRSFSRSQRGWFSKLCGDFFFFAPAF